MSLIVDTKYVGIVAGRLERFKRIKSNHWNFRCPICGDSRKSTTKARGYLYAQKGDLLYKCHNCGVCCGFANFLKQVDSPLFKRYCIESFADKPTVSKPTAKKKIKTNISVWKFDDLKSIKELDDDHFAKRYLIERKIPKRFFKELYFAPNYAEWLAKMDPKQSVNVSDDARILIPYWDEYSRLTMVQARSPYPRATIKYITTKVHPSFPKIYGLNRVDSSKIIDAVEGPFDCMFLRNGIATGGISLSALKDMFTPSIIRLVLDNEPRNEHIIGYMRKAIQMGFNVVVWPDYVTENDINDMILSGKSKDDIDLLLRSNSYSGAAGLLAINKWKKTSR